MPGAVHDADVGVLRGDGVGELARAVGGVVVDDEEVGVREGAAHCVDEPRQVVLLVVSGRDDERARHVEGATVASNHVRRKRRSTSGGDASAAAASPKFL